VHFNGEPGIQVWPKRWSYRHSFVVWLLREWGELSIPVIVKLSYESQERTMPVISDLLNSGFVIQIKNGALILSTPIREMQTNVMAVEAKLRNWREALSQAKRYKDFANTVFVAMDASTTPNSPDILSLFKNEQIGLCAVAPGLVNWLIFPETRLQVPSHEKEYIVMSATNPVTQTLWSRRKYRKASYQD
jgi:hypothetical protein